MLPVLRYTILRLALFLTVLVILSIPPVNAGPVVAFVLAAVISALLSYVLLSRQREQVAEVVSERAARRLKEPSGPTDEEIEDAAVDRAAAGDEGTRDAGPATGTGGN